MSVVGTRIPSAPPKRSMRQIGSCNQCRRMRRRCDRRTPCSECTYRHRNCEYSESTTQQIRQRHARSHLMGGGAATTPAMGGGSTSHRSCARCVRLHRSCSRERPSCTNCASLRNECVYSSRNTQQILREHAGGGAISRPVGQGSDNPNRKRTLSRNHDNDRPFKTPSTMELTADGRVVPSGTTTTNVPWVQSSKH